MIAQVSTSLCTLWRNSLKFGIYRIYFLICTLYSSINTRENKTETNPYLQGAYILGGRERDTIEKITKCI